MTGRVINNALPSSVDVVILASDVERVYRRLCLAQTTLSVVVFYHDNAMPSADYDVAECLSVVRLSHFSTVSKQLSTSSIFHCLVAPFNSNFLGTCWNS